MEEKRKITVNIGSPLGIIVNISLKQSRVADPDLAGCFGRIRKILTKLGFGLFFQYLLSKVIIKFYT